MTACIGQLNIDSAMEGASLRLKMTGQADLRDGGELSLRLLGFHHEAVSHHAEKVDVDLKGVEFMNSTALGAFVKWMAEILKLTRENRYQIVLSGTRARRWQRISLHALAAFGPETITVNLDA